MERTPSCKFLHSSHLNLSPSTQFQEAHAKVVRNRTEISKISDFWVQWLGRIFPLIYKQHKPLVTFILSDLSHPTLRELAYHWSIPYTQVIRADVSLSSLGDSLNSMPWVLELSIAISAPQNGGFSRTRLILNVVSRWLCCRYTSLQSFTIHIPVRMVQSGRFSRESLPQKKGSLTAG